MCIAFGFFDCLAVVWPIVYQFMLNERLNCIQSDPASCGHRVKYGGSLYFKVETFRKWHNNWKQCTQFTCTVKILPTYCQLKALNILGTVVRALWKRILVAALTLNVNNVPAIFVSFPVKSFHVKFELSSVCQNLCYAFGESIRSGTWGNRSPPPLTLFSQSNKFLERTACSRLFGLRFPMKVDFFSAHTRNGRNADFNNSSGRSRE